MCRWPPAGLAAFFLLATPSSAGTLTLDPPLCASKVTGVVFDLTWLAQQCVAMSGDCVGADRSPIDCAGDVFGMLAAASDALENAAIGALACGGEDTSCWSCSLDSAEYLASIASSLIGAASNCDVDVFLCIINVVDTADSIVNLAADLRGAIQSCPTPPPVWQTVNKVKWKQNQKTATSKHAAKQALKSGDYSAGQSSSGQVSEFYKAVMATINNADHPTADSHGIYNVNSMGGGYTITAVDDSGLVRVGGSYIAPNTDSYLFSEDAPGFQAMEEHARRLASRSNVIFLDKNAARLNAEENYGFETKFYE